MSQEEEKKTSSEEQKPEEVKVEAATEEQKQDNAPEETAPESAEEASTDESTEGEKPKTLEEERAEEEHAIPEEFDGKSEAVELPHKNIESGMVVRVHEIITDTNSKGEEKTRTQVFEGLVIGVKGSGTSRTMTVRKNSKGWMVEKIFPLSSPVIEKIEVVKKYKNRRAKMTFLRGRFRRKLKEQK